MTKKRKIIIKMCLGAMFIALGIVLPFISLASSELGTLLCPMHLPVLLAGIILGPIYGMVIGFVIPLLRMLIVGMPPILTAIPMAFELLTYGALSGLLFRVFLKKVKLNVIFSSLISLVIAMIIGRFVNVFAKAITLSIAGSTFAWKALFTAAFVKTWLGVIIQLIIIPIIVRTLIINKSCKDLIYE